MSTPSYYFTLFPKLQVLGHVPKASNHGAGVGGFNLTNPKAVFGSSDTGALLGPTNHPGDSPVWAVLNSKAQGNNGFAPVLVGGKNWPTMPATDKPAWLEFQVNAPPPGLVSVLGDWITAGKTDDVPDGVIAAVPPPIKKPDSGIRLFACNLPGDDGLTAVPADYWATSLIFLVDPATGATANPAQLAADDEYYLAAVIGNRGDTGAGRYVDESGTHTSAEVRAWVMVWNTGFSPAVKLPALSNLDVGATNSTHELYSVKTGYAIAGFRLPVQTVFDGLIQAIEDAAVDLGGLMPHQWVHAKNAHLCAKVAVRHGNQGWPAATETPLQSRRVGQKNLAPFAIDLEAEDLEPDIEWTHFMLGTPPQGARARARRYELLIRKRLRQPVEVYLAFPQRTHEALVEEVTGSEIVDVGGQVPFPEAVTYLCESNAGRILLRPFRGRRYAVAAIGLRYRRPELTEGLVGWVSVVQRPTSPRARNVVGGFTLEVLARDGSDGTWTAGLPREGQAH